MEQTLSGLTQFDVDWSKSKIIILDDLSTDNLKERVAPFVDRLNIELIELDSSEHPLARGLSKPILPVYAINHGVERADTEYVILSCPEVSPLLSSRRDSLQRFINYPLVSKQCLFSIVFHQLRDGSMAKIVAASTFWPFFFFGKIRKVDWQAIGGYDESFMGHVSCGDAEMDCRMSRNGYTNLFAGEPVMLHCYHTTDGFSTHPDKCQAAEDYYKEVYEKHTLIVQNNYVER